MGQPKEKPRQRRGTAGDRAKPGDPKSVAVLDGILRASRDADADRGTDVTDMDREAREKVLFGR